jgi:hypothetical protein
MNRFLLSFPILLVSLAAGQNSDSLTVEEREASSVLSESFNPDLIINYDKEVKAKPSSCKRRWQRSLLLLKNGEVRSTTGEDIDTLLKNPIWKTQGERLKAMHLYLLGRTEEAALLMRQNIRNNVNIVEQAGLLASIYGARKDTTAALAAYLYAWEQHKDENVYIELLSVHQRWHRRPPQKVLDQGTQIFSTNPGVLTALTETYFAAGKGSDLRKCLKIATHAEKTLWPRSMDWKIIHARALISLNRKREAKAVLLQAMDLMEEDPRLEGEDGIYRKQVFALLETV